MKNRIMNAACVVMALAISTSVVSAQTSDPVRLFETVGLPDCDAQYDNGTNYYRSKATKAVRLDGDDLTRAVAFLQSQFEGNILAVLYTYAPESTAKERGQPALVPLGKRNGEWCGIGYIGSYGMQPFVYFEQKYRDIVK